MRTLTLLSLLALTSGCASKLVPPDLPGDRHERVLVCFDGPNFPKARKRAASILPVMEPSSRIGLELQQRFLADYAERKDRFREQAKVAGVSVPANLKPVACGPLGWTYGDVLLNPDRRMPGDLVAELRELGRGDVVLLGEAYFVVGDWQGTTSTPQRVSFGIAFQWASFSLKNGEPLSQGFVIEKDTYVSEVRLPKRPLKLAISADEEVEAARTALQDAIHQTVLTRHLYRVDDR